MANGRETQSAKFIEAARELGCDESEETFRAALRKVASAPPAPKKTFNPEPEK
jgi:hypothetical protein